MITGYLIPSDVTLPIITRRGKGNICNREHPASAIAAIAQGIFDPSLFPKVTETQRTELSAQIENHKITICTHQ